MTALCWFVLVPAALALCGAGGGCGSDEGGAEKPDAGTPPCDCEAIVARADCTVPGQQCRCDDPCNALCDLVWVECVEGTWEVVSSCAYLSACPKDPPLDGAPCCQFTAYTSHRLDTQCHYDSCPAGEPTYPVAECVGWPAQWVVRGEPCRS